MRFSYFDTVCSTMFLRTIVCDEKRNQVFQKVSRSFFFFSSPVSNSGSGGGGSMIV